VLNQVPKGVRTAAYQKAYLHLLSIRSPFQFSPNLSNKLARGEDKVPREEGRGLGAELAIQVMIVP
jgi:hypothetical protein